MQEIHRSTTTWLARRTGRGSRARPPHRSHRRRLTLEPLEGRALLSLTTWTVNSLGDTGTGTGTSGDLRYVITQADQTQGDNTINFAVTGQITLNSALPDLSNTTGLMDIEGPGASSLTVARSSAAAADFRIFTVDANVQAQLVGLTITRGRANAYYGGGIDNGGTLTVADSSVIGNSVLIYSGGFTGGGGIENESGATLTVTNSIVGYNSVPIGGQGGGISNDGTMTVTNSSIDNNSAPSSFASGGSGGAGIINLGTLTVTNSTIDNNSAGAGGGGIGNNGTLTVTGSTIANNSAAAGGGILNDSLEGSMTVTNSTIAGNSATATSFNPGDGGGIWDFNGPLTVTNSTIADNNVPSGGLGGGLDDGSTTAILDNTIVAINTSGGATPNDIAGTVSSTSAYNLVGIGGSGGLVNGINGNQVGVADPGLSRLADNGGSTETIALLTGSPAIDKGSNALAVDPTTGQPLTTDQRGPGFPRIVNGTVDIGAYEFQTTSSLAVTTQPPASVAAGSSFGLSVTAKDSSGNVDTSFTGTVTVALGSNPVDGILGGTLSVTAQSGVASFLDLTLDKVGTGYTLLVSATGLDGATTNDITVTPAAVTQLVVTSQPPPAVAPDSAFGLVVAACDPFGNVDTSFSGSVAVALLNNPGGATLGGTLSVTAQGGVATFSDLTLNELGFGYTLSVSYSGLTTATTNAFNVTTTTWTVNSLGDTGTGSGTSGDLRYVITQADQTPGDNTINFAVTGTITLNSALPDLSNTSGLIDIEGPGASSLTVSRGAAAGTPDFGILTVDAFVQARLAGLTITGGSASSGGGIDNAGTLTVTNSTIDNNSVPIEGSGGGIYNGGTLAVTNSTIDNNSASFDGFGGGIENDATLIVTNSTIDNNLAGWGGGGIGNRGTLTVTNSTVGDNSATGEFIGRPGGGIYNYGGTLTVTDSTIAYNSAAGDGGGIGNNGTLTVTNSTIAYNVAGGGGGGGGGGIASSGTLTVTNSTIAYNSAYGGGGIYNNAGTLTVTDSTIAYNSCNLAGQPVVVEGGGLAIGGGSTATLENTIVAVNTSGSAATSNDIALYSGGTVSSTSAYNLIGVGGSGGLVNGTNGNQVGVAHPGLDPNGLQNNGGPTQTIALLPGSPAIDAGSPALAVDPTTGLPLTTDQRGAGFSRTVNGTVDIGAFEVQATNQLAVTAQPPGSVTAGSGFGFTVTAEDKSDNVLSSFNGTVTVALDTNPGGATLGGTLSVAAQSGVATFSNLTLNKSGSGYTLLVSGSGLGGSTTTAITVTPAAASQLVVSSQPPGSVLAGSGFGLVVTAEDPFDNVDTNFGGSVAVALLSNPGGATLGGTPSVTAQNGVATFSSLTLNEPGVGYTLTVSSSGLTTATTSAFNVQTQIATVAVGWGTQTVALQTASDGLRLLPAGRNTDIPWLGIDRILITLNQAATLAAGDITVIGSSGTNYGPVTVSGSGTSYTITLSQAINAADRVTITIGNELIASFTRRLDVLPGDVNDDGVVNVQDMVAIRNQMLGLLGAVPTIFGDINGDGKVDINDYTAVRKLIGTTLPRIT
ncbi:MAG: dockerin type I repeat-containing protein [Isosphaeraceae bacterium]